MFHFAARVRGFIPPEALRTGEERRRERETQKKAKLFNTSHCRDSTRIFLTHTHTHKRTLLLIVIIIAKSGGEGKEDPNKEEKERALGCVERVDVVAGRRVTG